MNRQQRRADKCTRHLPPQANVLWIPAARGYLARFSPGKFTTVENVHHAMHLCGDRASETALNFKKATGFNAAVRPLRNFQ